MTIIEFPNCTFRYFPEARYCETVFKEGIVPAQPHDTEAYRETARELGYGNDTLALCREHEVFHTFLWTKSGYPRSTTLWAVINEFQIGVPGWEFDSEEAVVMGFQRYLNTGEASKPLLDWVERSYQDLNSLKIEGLAIQDYLKAAS